ncbi:MAG: VOC family protein [Pikeienuella sp.]
MPLRLRQICLAAERLEPVVEELRALLRVAPCHRDPEVAAFGLENALFRAGEAYIEVVAPIRPGTAAGRFLERRGGGGYMVITEAPTRAAQDQARARAAAAGVRVAWERDYGDWRLMQLHPRDMIASFLEIDWVEGGPAGRWPPASEDRSEGAPGIESVAAVELRGPDPAALASHWAGIAGAAAAPGLTLRLANADLRFAASEGAPGLSAVDLRAPGRAPESAAICGVRFNFIA